MISFSSLSKRRGATLAGVFSLALSCVLLLCGAGSAPIENLLPQGAMQGDLNAGGHNLTNAATVYATAVNAASVAVSGTLTAPSSFTLPFSKLTSTPTTLSGYGITDPIVLTGGSYANPAWLTSLAASKLTGALPAISGASLTGLTFSQIGGTPTTLSGYGITDGEPALGNPSTSGYVLSSTSGGTRSWIAPGSLALDSSVTAVGFSYGSPTAGTLYLSGTNGANQLVQLDSSGNLTLAGNFSFGSLPLIFNGFQFGDLSSTESGLALDFSSGQISSNTGLMLIDFNYGYILNSNSIAIDVNGESLHAYDNSTSLSWGSPGTVSVANLDGLSAGQIYVAQGLGLTSRAATSSDIAELIPAGAFSATGTATTAFTVTIGRTMPDTNYTAAVSPRNALSATGWYVSAKTTTTFTVTYLTALTGAVAFDWSVIEQ